MRFLPNRPAQNCRFMDGHYLLWKMLSWELRRAFLPRSAVLERPIWEADLKIFISDARLVQVCAYVFLYFITFAAGALIFCSYDYPLQDSLFEVASALGTVGLSIGVTSVNSPDILLWVETIAMFLGRLEFFVIFFSIFKLLIDLHRMYG
jgi:trk system potassium uptake protein TrkH